MKRLIPVLVAITALAVTACGGGSATVHSPPQVGHPNARAALTANTPQPRVSRHSRRLLDLAPVNVAATPTGPAAPSDGWKVAYADGFGKPLGVGGDNTWKLDQRDQGCCNNSNEICAERTEMVSVTPEGLTLTVARREVAGKPYVCAGVSGWGGGPGESDPSGYRTPKVEWRGQTTAFEFVAKLPPNPGRIADPGIWMDGNPWTDVEVDFPEFWGYGSGCKTGWEGCVDGYIWFSSPHPELDGKVQGSFDPSAGFHRYTTEMWPVGSGKYRYGVWIDGQRQSLPSSKNNWQPVTESPEVTADQATKDVLILTYALRSGGSGFTGSNSFVVRSAAIYENSGGNGITGGGIAPGTTVGSNPEPPKEETTPTPPPPPPPTAPAVPTGCKAEGFLEGTTGKTRASCNTPPSGVSIEWQRTGPWTCAAQATPRYPIWTTGNPITNGLCVEHGKRYDWSARAHNSSGTSAWTTPMPAYTP